MVNAPSADTPTQGRSISLQSRAERRSASNAGHWSNPVRDLRRETRTATGMRSSVPRQILSLSRTGRSSRTGSPSPQPDWPPHTSQPGFVSSPTRLKTQAFRRNCPTSWLLELSPSSSRKGSTAVHSPGDFLQSGVRLRQSAWADAAVLLGTKDGLEVDSPDLLYVAVCALFAIVSPCHRERASRRVQEQQAKRCGQGRPMLIVPYGLGSA